MFDKTTMQVPAQVKEIAEKTVDEAEKAIAAFFEAASKSVEMVPAPAKEVSQKTLSLTQENMQAAFEHTRKLLQVSDVSEFTRLQSEYLTTQFANLQAQMKQFSTATPSSRPTLPTDPDK